MSSIQSRPLFRVSKHRFAALTLIGVYPLITALLYAVMPLTAGWPIWQRTLIIAPLMVTMMVYGLIPTIQKRFARVISVPLAEVKG